jgi:hypothetical protein
MSSSQALKGLECENDHSPSSTTKAKDTWSIIYIVFMPPQSIWLGHRNRFTIIFYLLLLKLA